MPNGRSFFFTRDVAACMAVVGLACAAGCGGQPSVEELIDQAAELPGVRSSDHSRLRQEFRLIEQSKTLPKMLNPAERPLAHQNVAVALAEVLEDGELVQRVNDTASALLTTLPAADAEFAKAESGALSAEWFKVTQRVADASDLPECDFGLHFERGYFNNLIFLPRTAAACRLLLVDAVHLAPRKPAEALRRFDQAWQWTDRLADTNHLEARVQAALLRREALAVAELLANRAETRAADLEQLAVTFERSRKRWPSMRHTLERERALALVTYEAIRLGLVDLLFTLDERSQLRADGVYDSLRKASPEQIDADQAAYLQYMREVLAVADRPFFARASDLVECDRLLRASEHTDQYPWFANHLFVLRDSLTLAQGELARDRAQVEAWLHLLADVLDRPAPPYPTNPLTGEPYVVEVRGQHRIVALDDRRAMNPRVRVPEKQ